jgi:putative ABC transport system permease protein
MSFADRLLGAFRVLLRDKGFAAHAILILALGIGATSAVFSLIYGALLTPPPYEEPERLVLISPRATTERAVPQAWSQDQYEEWSNSESLKSVAGYRWMFNFLVLEDGSEALEGMLVTPQYFDVTGLVPQIGRSFTESDVANTEAPSILLSHELWQRQFHGDPAVIGRTVRLSRDASRTVIGVMPPDVRFLPSPAVAAEPNYDVHAKVDYWIPIFAGPQAAPRTAPFLNVVARLDDGFTVDEAQNELAVIMGRQAEDNEALRGVAATVEPVTSVLNTDGRRILLPLLAAAVLVLLISCGNTAALLLVRGLQHRHEYGVRSAMGANRAALFKQVLGESLLLAALGGAIGVAIGAGVVVLFQSIGRNAIPRLDAVSLGSPILLFGVGAAFVACALAGFFPAWHTARQDPVEALRASESKTTAGRAQRRVLGGVLVLQMSLTLALLIVAGLLVRTMHNVDAVESGFDTSSIVTMSVTAVDGDWADFHERALERVSALPGVESAAFAWGVPLTGNSWGGRVEVEGYAPGDGSAPRVAVPLRAVTPGYFALLGQTIEEGRDFTSLDRRTAPPQPNTASTDRLVAIVNRTFADRYWPNGNAIGKKLWRGSREQPALEVVGIVNDTRTNDLTRVAEPEIYMPLWQAAAYSKHLVVRSSMDPSSIIGAVRRELRALLPTVGIEAVQTLDNIRARSLAPRTFAMQLLVGFAAVASVLTLAGVYSVLALSVTARRREIAIRSALGAARGTVMSMIVGDGLRLIAGGVVLGLGISFVLSRALRTLLFGVGPTDPTTLAAAALTFVVVALLACCIPAARAARVQPAEALKSE